MLQVLAPSESQPVPAPTTLLLLILGAGVLKLSLFPLLNTDMTFYVLPWLAEIQANGTAVLGQDLTDYSPGYTYLLLLAAMLPEQIPPVMAVKLISVAGGGDTVAALAHAGVKDSFTYVSTAGGAFLEWMEGKPLPGVQALKK